nr:VP1 [Bovine rhinitis A virus]
VTTDVGESGVGHDATVERLGGVDAPSFRTHTDVSWVLDRYAIAAKVAGYKASLGAGLVLDPVALPTTSMMGQLLRAATYYFADLELAVVPRGQPGEYAMVKWLPVGTPFDLADTGLDGLALQGLDSTCSVGFTGSAGNGSAAVMAIPYNSPMRVIPTVYAGTTQYTHVSPARPGTANYGLIFVIGDSGVTFRVMYRLKRTELYCPRPLVYRQKNTVTFGKRQKFKLAGIDKE